MHGSLGVRVRENNLRAFGKINDFKNEAMNRKSALLYSLTQRWDLPVIEEAKRMIDHDILNRAIKYKHIINDFYTIKLKITNESLFKDTRKLSNLCWFYSAYSKYDELCSINSTMVGYLMDNIKHYIGRIDQIYIRDRIIRKWNEKMSGTNYMCPKSAPTNMEIDRAEETIAKLGLENSLNRRYAIVDDLDTI